MFQYDFFDNPWFRPPDLFIEQITAPYRSQGWWNGPDNPELVRRIIRGSRCFLVAEKGSQGFYEPVGFKPMTNSIPMILSRP